MTSPWTARYLDLSVSLANPKPSPRTAFENLCRRQRCGSKKSKRVRKARFVFVLALPHRITAWAGDNEFGRWLLPEQLLCGLHTFSADEDLLLDEMPWKSHTRKRVALLIDIITSLTADRRPCRRLTRRHFLGRPGVGARRLDATALDDEDRERELRSDAVLSARRRCKRRH